MPENEQNQCKMSHCASKQQNMTKMRSNSLKIAIENRPKIAPKICKCLLKIIFTLGVIYGIFLTGLFLSIFGCLLARVKFFSVEELKFNYWEVRIFLSFGQIFSQFFAVRTLLEVFFCQMRKSLSWLVRQLLSVPGKNHTVL